MHFLRFRLAEEHRAGFAQSPVRIVVDHPNYQADVALNEAQHAELARDLL